MEVDQAGHLRACESGFASGVYPGGFVHTFSNAGLYYAGLWRWRATQ